MKNTHIVPQAKNRAISDAKMIQSVLSRDNKHISPGQWTLTEELMDRIYQEAGDPKYRTEYRVSDFL